MITGIGTPINQSKMPRPIANLLCSFACFETAKVEGKFLMRSLEHPAFKWNHLKADKML